MKTSHSATACIGLRAKTARAIAVVVSGTARAPRAVIRTEIVIETSTTALRQPYHEVMDLPWDRAVAAARKPERALEAAATRALKAFLADLRGRGIEVARIAIVGAPERNLKAIGSPHIRAHAAEGVLYRHVWQVAAEALGVHSIAFPEKGFEAFAASHLHLSVEALRTQLVEFGQTLGRPWRADEKAAAMGAWLALAAKAES